MNERSNVKKKDKLWTKVIILISVVLALPIFISTLKYSSWDKIDVTEADYVALEQNIYHSSEVKKIEILNPEEISSYEVTYYDEGNIRVTLESEKVIVISEFAPGYYIDFITREPKYTAQGMTLASIGMAVFIFGLLWFILTIIFYILKGIVLVSQKLLL